MWRLLSVHVYPKREGGGSKDSLACARRSQKLTENNVGKWEEEGGKERKRLLCALLRCKETAG